jgi:hypothetical protein
MCCLACCCVLQLAAGSSTLPLCILAANDWQMLPARQPVMYMQDLALHQCMRLTSCWADRGCSQSPSCCSDFDLMLARSCSNNDSTPQHVLV